MSSTKNVAAPSCDFCGIVGQYDLNPQRQQTIGEKRKNSDFHMKEDPWDFEDLNTEVIFKNLVNHCFITPHTPTLPSVTKSHGRFPHPTACTSPTYSLLTITRSNHAKRQG